MSGYNNKLIKDLHMGKTTLTPHTLRKTTRGMVTPPNPHLCMNGQGIEKLKYKNIEHSKRN